MNLKSKKVKILNIEKLGINYVNNPKVGCSSIKYSLLKDQTIIHNDEIYSSYEELNCINFFTVVRSPYSRIISGFLDKISRPSNIRDEICEQYFRTFGKQISLEQIQGDRNGLLTFLLVLQKLFKADVESINPHFRPQYYNVLPSVFKYQFIGKLERMDEVASYLNGYGIQLEAYSPHSTGAKNKISHFINDEIAEIIKYMYKIDFQTFGYSEDPNVQIK